MAYDKLTGDVKWKTPNLGNESYASPTVLGTAKIGEEAYATPAFGGDRIYIRGVTHLFCIAEHE